MKIKKIICFSIAAGFYLLANNPLTAQLPNGDNGNHKVKPGYKAEGATVAVKVMDYKSFLEYVRQNAPVLKDDKGRINIDRNGITFPGKPKRMFAKSKENLTAEWGYLSTDKRRIAISAEGTHLVKILDNSGRELRIVTMPKFMDGALAFSNTRIFNMKSTMDDNGGVEIYTSTGQFIKLVDAHKEVSIHSVSNTEKYFGVVVGNSQDGDMFVLYDMDGNRLWEYKIVEGEGEIVFSPDDKFAILKLSRYWVSKDSADRYRTIEKERKVYIFDIKTRKLISEEDYEE